MATSVAPIARTPSKKALDELIDNLADASVTVAARAGRTEALLDKWLGKGKQQHIIDRGERLFQRNSQLDQNWQNMRRAVADRLMPAVQKRSPHALNAATLVENGQVEKLMNKSVGLTIDQLVHFGLIPQGPASAIKADMAKELRYLLLPEALTFMYAQQASERCLQEAVRTQGYLVSKVADVVLDKLGPLMESISDVKSQPPFTAEELDKIARIERFVKAVSPSDLEAIEVSEADEDKKEEVEFIKRKIFLMLAESYTPEELDRMEAFYKTADGKEFRHLHEGVTALTKEVVNGVMQSVLAKNGYGPSTMLADFDEDEVSDDSDDESVTELPQSA